MEPQGPGGLARSAPVRFGDLPDFGRDDFAAAFACFRASAERIVGHDAELRPALRSPADLLKVCTVALDLAPDLVPEEARRFFETWFEPRVVGGATDAFFTGYYEPIVEGAPEPSAAFMAPLLGRPDDLVTFAADEPRPAWASGLAAARLRPDGGLEPYPVRAAIEAAAIAGGYRPVVWLRDWVEVFLIQVQGSARVRLPDGRLLRLTYAGRNGHPYTSVGRLLVDGGQIAPAAMSLDRLKGWLRANGLAPGTPARDTMARNLSYIFFEAAPAEAGAGPTGGQGLPLTRLRSIAVDRSLWAYGLPFWVDAVLPWAGVDATPLRRLMIAQDTGSAIVGPGRIDLFFGSGPKAGARAGAIRHAGRLAVLRPRAGR